MRTIEAHTSTNAAEDPLRWRNYALALKNAGRRSKNVGSTFAALGASLGGGVKIGADRVQMVQLIALAAEAGLAVFQLAASSPQDEVQVQLGGQSLLLPGVGAFGQSGPDGWMDAYCYARTIRDPELAASLVDLVGTVDDFRSFRGGASEEYNYRLVKAIAGLHQGKSWWDGELELARQAAETPRVNGWWSKKMLAWMDALHFLVQGEAAGFNEQLAECLERHRKYYEMKNHSHRLQGLYGVRAVGLAVLALEAGVPVEVRSDYMPLWLVSGDLPAFNPGSFEA